MLFEYVVVSQIRWCNQTAIINAKCVRKSGNLQNIFPYFFFKSNKKYYQFCKKMLHAMYIDSLK